MLTNEDRLAFIGTVSPSVVTTPSMKVVLSTHYTGDFLGANISRLHYKSTLSPVAYSPSVFPPGHKAIMSEDRVTEGRAPFVISGVETCETYYKIFGDLNSSSSPVMVLHGGPGSGHNYLLAFRKLWVLYEIPVIFYDQIGCGKSTHLRHKKGDQAFWTPELMVHQVEELVKHLDLVREGGPGYSVLGHSVGGMIGACFAARRPAGLKRLVLANAPGSADLHIRGLELCRQDLSKDTRETLEEMIYKRDWESQRFRAARAVVLRTNWCRADPYPEELKQTQRNHEEDSTVTESMYGPSPYELVGSLKGWDCFGDLPNINVPTLVYNGEWDIEKDEVIAPYVDHIPGVRKVTVERASHMSHLDNEDCEARVLDLVSSFLKE